MQQQNRKQLRQFGLLVGGILVLIGVWQWYRGHHETVRIVLWSIGGVLIGAGLIVPTRLAPVYVAWMKFAFLLGWVNTRILLSVIFFLLLAPVGLVSRLFGRDSLDQRISPQTNSYWKPRQPQSAVREHCERQY